MLNKVIVETEIYGELDIFDKYVMTKCKIKLDVMNIIGFTTKWNTKLRSEYTCT